MQSIPCPSGVHSLMRESEPVISVLSRMLRKKYRKGCFDKCLIYQEISPLCAYSLSVCVCVCVCVCARARARSVVYNSSGPMDYRPPGSSVCGISQATTLESGLPFAALGDLPDPEIEPVSPPLAGRFFTTEPPGKPS